MTQIKYVFLVFRKNKDTNSLEPFIFNVKELTPAHQNILKRVEKLIKHELPYRFGILSPDEYNNGKGNEIDPFDNEYKLWYSRHRYGEFFHIVTEYVHTMSNISNKAHNYKNSITLEELIYSCGLTSNSGNPFFKDVRLEYEIRDYKITNEHKFNLKLPPQSTDCSKYEVGKPNESRSDLVFCLYEKEKLRRAQELKRNKSMQVVSSNHKPFELSFSTKSTHKNLTEDKQKLKQIFNENQTNNKIRFILMFKTHQQNYTFIYSYDDDGDGKNVKFYKLVIESNMVNMLDSIINELNKKVLSNTFNDNTIKFEDNNNIFKVVSNDKINMDDNDYKNIFTYNPFIENNIQCIPNIIDISYYYKTSLLKFTKPIGKAINLYKDIKPYIYTNNINGKTYIEGLKKYNEKSINSECINITYEPKFNDCAVNICNSENVIINCAYYNLNNCGYDFIEYINPIYNNKLVIYIVPHKYNEQENKPKYLGNFLDFDNTSLPMLIEFKKKYVNENNVCFLHHTMQLRYYTLHFHIVKKQYYKREFPKIEIGSFIIQDIFIDKVINNIQINNNYYKTLNYNIIKTT